MILKTIAPGDKIELIRKTANEAKQRTYYSKILDIVSETEMIIAIPLDGGKVIPLELNSDYYVCTYSVNGLYRCEAAVVSRSKEDNLYTAVLQIKTRMQKYQRRQYYRLDCILMFNYRVEGENDWEKGVILDISGGGIRFKSNRQLVRDEKIECSMRLDLGTGIKMIVIMGAAIASVLVDLKTNLYENRLSFEDITNEDREDIIKFIFEEDRKRRQKEKGM